MKYTPRLLRLCRVVALSSVLWTLASVAHSQAPPAFVPGEIILYFQPGTPKADVDAVTAQVSPDKVTPMLLADCYDLTLPAARKTNQATLDAVAALKLDPRVRWVGPDMLYPNLDAPKTQPNDPRYKSGEQWNLAMIRMPEAWTIQKGQPNANVAVLDSGFNNAHEDLNGQYMAESYDFGDNDADYSPDSDAPVDDNQHGVHVSGIIIAKTDNNVGIAGICWQNIRCLACKTHKKGIAGNLNDGTAIINAATFVAQNATKLHIVALNMSFGGPGDPTDKANPFYVALRSAYDAGVVMVAAAGNSASDNRSFVPAGYDFVVSVSALGRTRALSSFSSFGKVEIAAPGGDQDATGILADGILSTFYNSYAFEQGTSMASPHVAAVATLLRSVPGVDRDKAISTLEATADKTGITSVPDPRFGFGILDAYSALLKVSVSVAVIDPNGVDANGNPTDPTGVVPQIQTLKPVIRLQFANVDPASVQVKIDGTVVVAGSADVTTYFESGTIPNQYTLAIRRKLNPGTHTIVVSGNDPAGDAPRTDTRQITITPYTLKAGRSFFSIPYTEALEPVMDQHTINGLLGSTFTLNRWDPTQAKYIAFHAGENQDQSPVINPADTKPSPDGTVTDDAGKTVTFTPPLGLAWFADTTADIPILTNGRNFPNNGFRIPLHKGWNMIGDPYNYVIAFNTALIELPNKSRLTAEQAVGQGIIQPNIYRYVDGEYTYRTLPDGSINPWEGHWIYMVPSGPYDTVTLILSPVASAGSTSTSRSAARSRAGTTGANVTADGTPIVTGTGSWTIRLVARAKNLTDSHNFIGMSSRATDNYDRTKVAKPPLVSPFVSLGMIRSDTQPGLYAQDLRALGGTKTWDVAVATDQTNTDIVLSWPNINTLPRNYRLTLTDKVSGQTVDMRQNSSYRFNSGTGSPTRAFTLTAKPAVSGGHAVFSNVFINPGLPTGRGTSLVKVGYTLSEDAQVEVSILGANGRMLAHVGATRAATRGDNTVTWNGRDDAGRALPAGVYTLQLRATSSEGEVTRTVRPFLNSGR